MPLSFAMRSNFDIKMVYLLKVPSLKGIAGQVLAASVCANCCACSLANLSWEAQRPDASCGVVSMWLFDGVGTLWAAGWRAGGIFFPEVDATRLFGQLFPLRLDKLEAS